MKSKQLFFFATLNDIKPIIEETETVLNVKYYLTGLFDDNYVIGYDSLLQIPDPGLTKHGDWNRIDNYICIPRDSTLNIEAVPQRKGGIKYAIDQKGNPQSIVIKLGGTYTEVSKVLIAGRVGTISSENFSLELFNQIVSRLKKRFKKRIGMFYSGSEASELSKKGWRLVTDVRDNPESDLKI